MHYPETKEIVQSAWNIARPSPIIAVAFLQRLNAVKKAITAWAKDKFKSPKKMLTNTKLVIQLLDKAEENRSLTNREFQLRIKLRKHVYQLAIDQEAKW